MSQTLIGKGGSGKLCGVHLLITHPTYSECQNKAVHQTLPFWKESGYTRLPNEVGATCGFILKMGEYLVNVWQGCKEKQDVFTHVVMY